MQDDWNKVLEDWVRSGKTQHLPKTQHDYGRMIEAFATFIVKPWADVTSEDVWKWRHELEREEYAPNTVLEYLRTLRAFFNQAVRNGLLSANPVKAECVPSKIHFANLRFLSVEEETRLLAAIDVDTPWGLRDYAILLFLLRSGRRPPEVLHLRWRDFDVQESQVWVSWIDRFRANIKDDAQPPDRKNRQARRTAQLDAEVWQALLSYLHGTGKLPGIRPTHFIFTPLTDATGSLLRLYGRNWRQHPLGAYTVSFYLKRYAFWAGLPSDEISLKALRYTAVQRLLSQGWTDQQVAEFTGYSNMNHARALFKRLR